jgi:Kef-type K+ transport system membrane component KefB/voltage-gated potassium channel Kch
MSATTFLETLGVLTVAAALVSYLGRLVRMPSIVSYLIAGLLVGPVAGRVAGGPSLHGPVETIAETGIVLLMFLVGLELRLDRIRQVGRVAFAAGLGQVVFTAAGGLLLCLVLGYGWLEATFISTALTFSSTVVVVKLLDEKGELQSLYGRIAVGIFLVQDLVVVVILTVLVGLGRPDAMTPTSVGLALAKAFGGMGLLLAVALLAARRLLPAAFGWALRTPRLAFMGSLAWCFGFVQSARALGLSLEIGAFLAGLSLASIDVASDLRRRMQPLMSFFVAIFFVSLGAGMQLAEARAHAWQAAILSVFVLVGNPFIFMWIIGRHGYSERTSFLTSVTVAQISEFSFIFAALGVGSGLIGRDILSLIAVVGIVTIALSAYMILYNGPLYDALARRGLLRVFRAGARPDEAPPADALSGHVVVVGMNALGRQVVGALVARGETVLAIDALPANLAGLPCRTLVGDVDYPATLQEARLGAAKLALATLRTEASTKLFVHGCRERGVPVAVYGFDRWTTEELSEAGATHIVESRSESGRRLLQELERLKVLPA